MWSSALDTGLDSGLPLTVACVQLGAPSRRERRGPTAQITCIRSISGRALRAVQPMHRCLCDTGRCRPAVPFQRPSRSLPVPRLVRREYSHHLSHGLFDVSASHRAHAKEPSRFVPQAKPISGGSTRCGIVSANGLRRDDVPRRPGGAGWVARSRFPERLRDGATCLESGREGSEHDGNEEGDEGESCQLRRRWCCWA
jgi:hypothetical protein